MSQPIKSKTRLLAKPGGEETTQANIFNYSIVALDSNPILGDFPDQMLLTELIKRAEKRLNNLLEIEKVIGRGRGGEQ